MAIYFITGNKGKYAEVKAVIPQVKQIKLDLPEIQEIDAKAIIKAKLIEALKHKKGEFIVEDTSLYLDCLNGLPGPLIKWFLQSIGNQGLYQLSQRYKNQKAQAMSIFGYARNSKQIKFFQGVIRGKIVKPKGSKGFGWDQIFQPQGFKKTFAQMEQVEKNHISMRRIALNSLKQYLIK